MNIRLVPKKIWSALTDSQFNSLPPDRRRTARSILRTMQNRHVGITPELSAQLAPLLLEPSAQLQTEGPWSHVLTRLTEELGSGSPKTGRRPQGFGVLLSAAPPYTVIRLAMPIVAEACRRIGMCCLFCEDDTGSMLTQGYRRYSEILSKEIETISQEKDDFLQISWKERALTLAGYSSRPGMWNCLPETDPTASALMLRLKPRVPQLKPLSRRTQPMTSPLRHRENVKTKEAGFSGIKITRRPEEIDDMLISEYLNPPLLLADRLVNSGFLALKRKPKHERLRDVLIAGFMPHDVRKTPNGDFIKACWYDFITRFSLMLARQRLVRSEFRWLEGDAFHRYRDCCFRLEDLPEPDPRTGSEPNAAFRRGFLVSLGWFPSYLDTLSGFAPVPPVSEPISAAGESDPLLPAMHWARAAWKGQKLKQERQGSPDDYTFSHVMLFLPASKRSAAGIPPNARLRQAYRIFGMGAPGSDSGRSVSITWVPETLEDFSKWAVDRQKRREPFLFTDSQAAIPPEEIAGRLEQVWLQHMIEEMRSG